LKFGLLPTLRVTRVTGEGGQDLHFIQKTEREMALFTPFSTKRRRWSSPFHHVEYGGDKVLTNAGSGSYYIGARQSWYPNLNGFGEKALYRSNVQVPPSTS